MRKFVGTVLALAASAGGLAAQEQVEEADLPQVVAEEMIDFFNDPTTIRFNGRARVPADGSIVGNVGVLGGPLDVEGRIEGNVVIVNGDLTLGASARITGDVTVIGGRVRTLPDGAIAGTLTIYDEPLPYQSRGGEVLLRGGPRTERRGIYLGDSRLTIRAGTNYNRLEGLPVLFGPVFRTSGRNPLRMEALAIWRTENAATRDGLGYRILLEQQLGVPARFRVGATAFSEVTPIEDWGLGDLEASLATFFFHRDYRDYYERQGFGLFTGFRVPGAPITLDLEYRHEEHLNVPVASPWTIRANDAPWRPLPLVAAGDIQTLGFSATLDQRNDTRDPTDGWYLQGRILRGLDGDLTRPTYMTPDPGETEEPVPAPTDFTAAFLDFRRYARVGPFSDLTFRGILGGSVDGAGLPAQLQHALGGEGSLPGFRPFHTDCGARSSLGLVERGTEEDPGQDFVFPSYGCDRVALFQVEYRGHLNIDLGLDPDDERDWEDWHWYPDVDFSPSWAVFFDAGRGWSATPGGSDSGTLADLGVGLFLGDLGVYWAYPLTGDDRGVNFFVRLQRRF